MTSYYHQRMAEIEAEMAARRSVVHVPERTALKLAAPTAKPTGHVYFLKAGNSVKIGFSTNLRERRKSIQTGCPANAIIVKVVAGTVKKEKAFHKRFAVYRQIGEWFDLRGSLAKYLERCVYAIELPGPTPQPETEFYL